jgi:hypothetical protein
MPSAAEVATALFTGRPGVRACEEIISISGEL